MSARRPAPEDQQPESFVFDEEYLARANIVIARYPAGRQASAVMPLLDLAQRQNKNWLPRAAMDYVARMLGMPPIRVYEVATFYTMYNLAPVGEYFLQICTSTPCWLRGSEDIVAACQEKLGINFGETTADGKFTMAEMECLGACVNGPMMQINDDFYEDLTAANTTSLLAALARGEQPPAGPQNDRHSSEPGGGATTLAGFTDLTGSTGPHTGAPAGGDD